MCQVGMMTSSCLCCWMFGRGSACGDDKISPGGWRIGVCQVSMITLAHFLTYIQYNVYNSRKVSQA